MPTRLWIGHWFSTAYHFVEMLKHNPDQHLFEIFGSSENAHSLVLRACHRRHVEPPLKGRAHVDYCLEFCRAQNIEVFIPGYRKLEAVAPYLSEFEAAGTRVLLCRDPELLRVLNDKAETYASVRALGLMEIPQHAVVNTAEQFQAAYERFRAQGLQVCFKPRGGQGGAGFRIIDDNFHTLQALYRLAGVRLGFAYARQLFASQPEFPDIMVSEYLDGPEYSLDCLAWDGRLLAAVPRRKLDNRRRYLEDNPQLLALAEHFAAAYRLPYVFNIQLRYRNGAPKLLEVNPRMPGGLHVSCLSGVNFPYLAVKLLLQNGHEVCAPRPVLNQMVGELEQPVLLEEAEPPELPTAGPFLSDTSLCAPLTPPS